MKMKKFVANAIIGTAVILTLASCGKFNKAGNLDETIMKLKAQKVEVTNKYLTDKGSIENKMAHYSDLKKLDSIGDAFEKNISKTDSALEKARKERQGMDVFGKDLTGAQDK